MKTKIIIFLALWQLSLPAQIMTKPLFMQIKSPKLESSTGVLIDSLHHHYLIETNKVDSVDITFTILVPKEMLSEQWAISLTPTIQSTHLDGILKDVVVKGWKFAEVQDEDYQQYNEFVDSIVDSSLYEKLYIDQDKLEKDIEQRHDQFWQYYYDEWERQVEYEIWKSKQDGSIKTYSMIDRNFYKEQLLMQYLLRIKNQSSRYLKVNMDTTGLYQKYMHEFELHNAKMPRFFVENNALKNVPKKYKDIYESKRTLDDITNSMQDLLEKRDSALMAILPVLDYRKIIENEKRTMLQDGIFDDIIQFPKNNNAIIDTIVYDITDDYYYQYTYTYPISGRMNDTISVKLFSKVLATDRSGFSSSSEETLTYIITSKDIHTTTPVKAKNRQNNTFPELEGLSDRLDKFSRINKDIIRIESDSTFIQMNSRVKNIGIEYITD